MHSVSEPLPKPFDIQRRRVGVIRYFDTEKKYGFVDAEDFREDVFFHMRDYEAAEGHDRPFVGLAVEFEVDEEHRRAEQKLRAKIIRPTRRPISRRLVPNDAPSLNPQHHPRSRQRKPAWRKKGE